MTQYNTLNVTLSNPKITKLKSGINSGFEVTLHVFGDSNDENNNTQVSKLCKAFANGWSANIKLKIGQSGGFLGRRLGPLQKTGLPLMKNVLKPLDKSVLIPLGLTTAASATNSAIYQKMFGSGRPSHFAYDCKDNLKWRYEWYYENS